MKKLFFALLCMVALCNTNAFADKRPIATSSLPKAAQQTIANNWPWATVINAVTDDGEYEVLLSDDTQVEFDKKGNWLEAECSDGLPETIIPVEIRIYVANRYPKVLITQIERKLDKKGQPLRYEVETANGMGLVFDKEGKFIKID